MTSAEGYRPDRTYDRLRGRHPHVSPTKEEAEEKIPQDSWDSRDGSDTRNRLVTFTLPLVLHRRSRVGPDQTGPMRIPSLVRKGWGRLWDDPGDVGAMEGRDDTCGGGRLIKPTAEDI